MLDPARYSRREFLARTALTVSTIAACSPSMAGAATESLADCPVVIFSKAYQELKLNFDDAAAVTSEAGLDGVDCPLRPGGEIVPEKAEEQLPRYVQALREHHLQMPLLATAITSTASPYAETILRTAKKLGVQYYRLGFIDRDKSVPIEKQVREVKAQLKDLAALNAQLGLGALLQNHSSSGGKAYFGGDLTELEQTVADFDPAQIGVAFDIAHALVVHGDEWRTHFERLKRHFRIAYIKDVKLSGGWVPFGQGAIGNVGYFKLLKEMRYHAPISLHLEFDWAEPGKGHTRAALVKALKSSRETLRGWLESK